MSAGSAQNVEVEHFLRDIERRGSRLHCAAIGQDDTRTHDDVTLLYRQSHLDWRHRDPGGVSQSSTHKDPSAAVAKVQNVASFQRHVRMGFMTVPVSQDLLPCSSAMVPRSRSCHLAGTGDLENKPPAGPTPGLTPTRQPPAKPKRHPSTRLSSNSHTAAPACAQVPVRPADKRSGAPVKKCEAVDVSARKVPPVKPKRNPNTQLSLDSPSAWLAAPSANEPHSLQESQGREEGDSEEPVYIEMVGRSVLRRAVAARSSSSSESDLSEVIYEEMKYPLPEEPEVQPLPPKQYKPGKPVRSSSCCSKATVGVSMCHSSCLPSSSSSTPVPYPVSSCPQPLCAPTLFLIQGIKLPTESADKIPAPFPNLLQHWPPLLAFPQPAAASSGVVIQQRAASAKLGAVSTQTYAGLAPPPYCSSSSSSSTTAVASSTTKLPVLQHGHKESTGSAGAHEDKVRMNGLGVHVGPGPGLQARSHSTPLPPTSQCFHYQHCHPQASHCHQSHRAEKDLVVSHNVKLSCHTMSSTGGSKEGRFARREWDREQEVGVYSAAPSLCTSSALAGSCVTLSPDPPCNPALSAVQRPSSRPLLYCSHTPQQLPYGLLTYQAPLPVSSMLWTYPSSGLKRPPAYQSLRGTAPHLLHSEGRSFSGRSSIPRSGSTAAPPQLGTGSLSREGSVCEAAVDEGPCWSTHRKVSLSHGSRDSERDDGSAGTHVRNKGEQEPGTSGGQSGIPVWCGGVGTEGTVQSSGPQASGHSRLHLPCQTFPSCHWNGELGRLGRPASTSGVRQGSSSVQRQSSLPRGILSQPQLPSPPTCSIPQLQLQLHYQHLAQGAQWQSEASAGTSPHFQRDGKLLEVIERKRCLCKEIKAQRHPERSLYKQDSMPILPSWARTPDATRAATLPCQRQQTVVWDTAI
ncbi:neuronal tyrosine-phosphorylated phosphoinositide-3-kinase adapter 1-like isoform X1 [Scleropages formosus]|uniref:neuronal tyrosine-phosphorylated phosphoinositide-3-kinase adapter 1-like isoform X1 n=1 Tax=Scleropages formosus TaxID=113540 RepID=UPI0010FABC73|nr:neuronal tyrosine-phosphorylated phosphoinositide-3-kinase adapter 1-like isoform X1 [Scleropages formosus]XP_018589165.2 neuronal tyrosine-phosphorylated phosphoinositide-3-kinase adapter 1-like isoform X1 [Scleropages formosus]XP_029113089.1 neuronal tyrosine-phosphorylated phosphoinositide-3-kinase adapter 1-like isoform X1 [Scleropages formosus]